MATIGSSTDKSENKIIKLSVHEIVSNQLHDAYATFDRCVLGIKETYDSTTNNIKKENNNRNKQQLLSTAN